MVTDESLDAGVEPDALPAAALAPEGETPSGAEPAGLEAVLASETVPAPAPLARNESHLPAHQEVHASCQRKGPSGLARFIVACTECSQKADNKAYRNQLLDSGILPALLRRAQALDSCVSLDQILNNNNNHTKQL